MVTEAQIKDAIRKKYAAVAASPEGKFGYPTGREGAAALGYEQVLIDGAPAALLRSFCGVGNPFSLGKVSPGHTVLDVGCGAGFDLYVAGRLVGASGRVCGIDLTSEMVDRARQNLAEASLDNFEVLQVSSEEIPFNDYTFDSVISNGVINLSTNKQQLFMEIFRVLKTGGKLQFADVVLEKDIPATMAGSLEAWSQ